jgi:hypothetical protein
MNKSISAADPWVDMFSENCFQGSRTRLRIDWAKSKARNGTRKVSRSRSVIVGPHTIVVVVFRDGSEDVILEPGTLVKDFSGLTSGKPIERVHVLVAPKEWN